MQVSLKKIYRLIIFTVILIVILWKFSSVLTFLSLILNILKPFIIGGIIAFILALPTKFLEEKFSKIKVFRSNKFMKKLLRPISFILALAVLIILIILLVNIIIPQLAESVTKLAVDINSGLPKLVEQIEEFTSNNENVTSFLSSVNLDYEAIQTKTVEFLKSGFSNILNLSFLTAVNLFTTVLNLVIAFIFSIYLIFGKENLIRQLQKVMRAYLKQRIIDRINYIASITNEIFSNFITGQLKEACILFLLFFIFMKIFSMPYAALISVIISVTSLVPIFGAFVGCLIGAFLILCVEPITALKFLILFLAIQQVEGNVIYPHVVGNSIGLPSIWVLVAVSIGGSLFGVVGIIFFIPLASILYRLFKEKVNKKLDENSTEQADNDLHENKGELE